MTENKIISSEDDYKITNGGIIGSEDHIVNENAPFQKISSLQDRISTSTESKGLEKVPDGFDEQSGDWIIIKSDNPFEILYLDYKQYMFIDTNIVQNNFSILEKFWREKFGIMNTGGNRVAFKNKYGEGTIEGSVLKLENARKKLSSQDGIIQYFNEVNTKRLKKGKENFIH